jgi:hypothetical protein
MKLQGAVFLIALFAVFQAVAQQPTNAPSASTTFMVQKPKLHWLAPVKTTKAKENLKPIGGLNPQAWTTVVGWHPGESAFPSAETHEGGWPLFWVSF